MKTAVIIISVILIVLAGINLIGWIFSAPAYKGPVSDHFDGKKFINPGGVKAKGFKDLWKWMRTRQRGEWTERMDIPNGSTPVAKVEGDSLKVTFVNHSTFLIQTMGINILTDPVWSERASPVFFAGPKRMRPPGLLLEELPKIHIILLTHNHYDHLDIKTLKRLTLEHQPVIYCPLGVGMYLKKKGIEKVMEMDWWGEEIFNEQLVILCTPAQHFSGRGMFDRDRTLWSGFALMAQQGNIYYSGDTGYGDFFREIAEKIYPIRLSFLPIGAYKPQWFMSPIHTSPGDALRIHQEINSPVSIAMHFGTFPLADDGERDPEMELNSLMEAGGLSKNEFLALEEGEAVSLR